ncbi:hypothetical protein HC256_005950 [Beauveria bassiana]|nr:hypothetical protein HC256_005950 [Beauveria bassiana]
MLAREQRTREAAICYVLVACIGKYDDWQGAQCLDGASPFNNANVAGVSVGISSKVVDNQDDQVADGDEGDDASVFERVEAAQEAEGNDKQHKSGDPEMAVDQVGKAFGMVGETLHDAGHQVANDDHVGDADAEAFYGDGEVEDDGSIGVGKLGEGEEGSCTAVEVSGASRLEVKAKGGGKGGPKDEDDTKHNTHVRKHKGHGEGAGSDDCSEVKDG